MEFKSGEELHLDVGTRHARIVKFVNVAVSRLTISSSSAHTGLQKTEPAAIIINQGMEDIVPLSKLSKPAIVKHNEEPITVTS